MSPRESRTDETAKVEDSTPPEAEKNETEGDFGGPYGYGRPAHRPDPSGHYRFEPDAVRPLPANPRIRWR
jgi:hypothetical protein